jgi:hypothetical protein
MRICVSSIAPAVTARAFALESPKACPEICRSSHSMLITRNLSTGTFRKPRADDDRGADGELSHERKLLLLVDCQNSNRNVKRGEIK